MADQLDPSVSDIRTAGGTSSESLKRPCTNFDSQHQDGPDAKRKSPPPRISTNEKETKKNSPPANLPPVFLKQTLATFDQQVKSLIEQISVSDFEFRKCDQMISHVYDAFRRVVPHLEPVVYGSYFTGLAQKTSDVDIFLRGSIPLERNFIRKHGRILYRNRFFDQVIVIDKARVPLVKARHIPTGLHLDISTTSAQAICNSQLIRFFKSFDSRVHQLLKLISFWSKYYQMSGTNKFTSYAVNLMVLFYLQCVTPRILPPVKDVTIKGKVPWTVVINHDQQLLANNNQSTLADLFRGFFLFYSKIDLSGSVLSLYTGKVYPAHCFTSAESLPDDMALLRDQAETLDPIPLANVNVQDPIELNLNTTRCVNRPLVRSFQKCVAKYVSVTQLPETQWIPTILNDTPEALPAPEIPSRPAQDHVYFFSLSSSIFDGITGQEILDEVSKALTLVLIKCVKNESAELSLSLSCEHSIYRKPAKKLFNKLVTGQTSRSSFETNFKSVAFKESEDKRFAARLNVEVASGRVKFKFEKDGEVNFNYAFFDAVQGYLARAVSYQKENKESSPPAEPIGDPAVETPDKKKMKRATPEEAHDETDEVNPLLRPILKVASLISSEN